MSYWKEITASAGLKLEPDTTPTSSTLGSHSPLVDEALYDQRGTAWEVDYAYGIDLGSVQSVDMLRVFMDAGCTPHPTDYWRDTYNGTLSVYSSDDNATWTLVQSAFCNETNFPLRQLCLSRVASFDIEFASPVTARYFKIVNTGSYSLQFNDAGSGFYNPKYPGAIKAYELASGDDPNILTPISVFMTWDPAGKAINISLSDGNLTATANNRSAKSVRATSGVSSGKWYWEITINYTAGNSSYWNDICVGVGTVNADLEATFTRSLYGWGVSAQGTPWHNDSPLGGGMPGWGYVQNGEVTVGIALDMIAGKMWFIGADEWGIASWTGTEYDHLGDPAAGTGEAISGISGYVYPMVALYENNGGADVTQMTANFGQSMFRHYVPSGFLPIGESYQPARDDVATWNPSDMGDNITLDSTLLVATHL